MPVELQTPPARPGRPAAPARGRMVPPLLPVLLPIVVAAVVTGVLFAWLFPPAPGGVIPVARFTDVTTEAGLPVLSDTAPSSPADEPTSLGGGVVVFDYDGDGHPDLFLVNGAPWPWEEPMAKRISRGGCALYHNDGRGHFTNVSSAAGLNVELQGMAAAAGDFDNDGLPDLFVTCVGSNHLFRNRGNGTFEDVTDSTGAGGEENTWSTGAAWIDYDGDGRLDLVVCHYARWPRDVDLQMAFSIAAVGRSYGNPTGFMGAFPSLYRNLGDGRFALVSGAGGLRTLDPQTGLPATRALSVATLDANGDGKLDLWFFYQTSGSLLFLNQGGGTFRQWATNLDERYEGGAAGLASAGPLPYTQGAGPDERLAALHAAPTLSRTDRDEGYGSL